MDNKANNYEKEEIEILAGKTIEDTKFEQFSSLDILNFDEINKIIVKNITEESYDENSIYKISFPKDFYIKIEYNITPTDSDEFDIFKHKTYTQKLQSWHPKIKPSQTLQKAF